MHGDSAFVARYGATLGGADLPDRVEVLLLPPAPYLAPLARVLEGGGAGGRVGLGVQNVHGEVSGAFTGEISAEMARDLGAGWALVGHSERRALFGETDGIVAGKLAAALRAGLVPVLCVGETLAEREAGSAEAVVRRQVRVVAEQAGAAALAAATVAYEPVWAIGTGRTATPEQAQAMHEVVRSEIEALCGAGGQCVGAAGSTGHRRCPGRRGVPGRRQFCRDRLSRDHRGPWRRRLRRCSSTDWETRWI